MADIEPTVFTKFTHYSLLIIVNEIIGLFRPPSTGNIINVRSLVGHYGDAAAQEGAGAQRSTSQN
jgi:hypothetical protein